MELINKDELAKIGATVELIKIITDKNVIDKSKFENLINFGANVNYLDENNWNILMHCAKNFKINSNIENVKYLIDNGVDINNKSKDNTNVLMIICKNINHNSSKQIFDFIIEKEIDVNVQDSSGRTALMLLSSRSKVTEEIKLMSLSLINKNANLNIQDKNGNTALTLAAKSYNKHKNIDLIRILINNCGEPNIINNKGNTARDIIVSKKIFDSINYVQNSVKAFINNDKNSLECDICAEGNNKDVIISTCGHTLCSFCLESLIKANKQCVGCRCPVCRQNFKKQNIFRFII